MYATVFHLTLAMIDVANCFQKILQEEYECLVITEPPYYLGWVPKKYPEIKIVADSPSSKYVLQLIKGLKGDKSIGHKWYDLLIKRLLDSFGFVACHVGPALY